MGRLLLEAYDLVKEIVWAYSRTTIVRPELGPCIGGWENTVITSTPRTLNHREVDDAIDWSGFAHKLFDGALSAGTREKPFARIPVSGVGTVQAVTGGDGSGSGRINGEYSFFCGFDTGIRQPSYRGGSESL